MNIRLLVCILLLLISVSVLRAKTYYTPVEIEAGQTLTNERVSSTGTCSYDVKCPICAGTTEIWINHQYNYFFIMDSCKHFKKVILKVDFFSEKSINKYEAKILELRKNIEHLETQLEMKD